MEKQKKTYRNSIRSEKAIIHAYVQLLQKKGKKKITVTDIVELADLNRSTFYGHFSSAEAVMERIRSDVFERLLGSLDKRDFRNSLGEPNIAMEHVLEFLQEDEGLYKALLNTDGADKFMKQLREAVVQKYLSDVATLRTITDKESFEMNLRMFVGGYAAIIKDWAAGDIKMPLDRCTKILSESIKHSVETYRE